MQNSRDPRAGGPAGAGRSDPGFSDLSAMDDAEILSLIDELTETFLGHLDPVDADILARADLRGQPPWQIGREIGRTRAEVEQRLCVARQSLCRFVVLTLSRSDRPC